MTFGDPGPLEAARTMLKQSLRELWVGYVSVGGTLSPQDLSEFFDRRRSIPSKEYDRLALSLNESFLDRGEDHPLAYSDEL